MLVLVIFTSTFYTVESLQITRILQVLKALKKRIIEFDIQHKKKSEYSYLYLLGHTNCLVDRPLYKQLVVTHEKN